MGKSDIPDRWRDYKPMGSVIPGTRFVACKVPLKQTLLRKLPPGERFGPDDLKKAVPKLGLLIDLTNTDRYYVYEEFTKENIEYEKIMCPGHVLPPNSIVKRFSDIVNHFIQTHEEDPEAVIAVHCTHGVNRTGYFICRYMIENLNIPPEDALLHFQGARGHEVERQNYVHDLKNGCSGGSEKDLNKVNQRFMKRKRDRDLNLEIYSGSNPYNTHKMWRSDNSEPEDFKRSNSGNYARNRNQSVYETGASRRRMPCDQMCAPDDLPNKRRIYGNRNGYNPNTYSHARRDYQPPRNQRFLPNGGRNVESDSRGDWCQGGESQEVPYKYVQTPSRPKYQKHEFRSGHQNRVSHEGNFATSDHPGSWIEEKKLRRLDSTPLRNEDLVQKSHLKNQQSLSKLHLNFRSYESKEFNDGNGVITNLAGPWRVECHRDTVDTAPSMVDQLQNNRRVPNHNVVPDPRNRQGNFPHPYMPQQHGQRRPDGEPQERPGASHPPGHYRNTDNAQHQQITYYTPTRTVYNTQNSVASNVELAQGLPRNDRGFRRRRR